MIDPLAWPDQADLARALAELEAARPVVEALRDLVWLKDGPRDKVYRDKKGNAWAAARTALAAVDLYHSATSDHPTGHRYLSTACLHGLHDQCGVKQAERGETGPPHCKHCPSVCICPCHPSTTGEKP